MHSLVPLPVLWGHRPGQEECQLRQGLSSGSAGRLLGCDFSAIARCWHRQGGLPCPKGSRQTTPSSVVQTGGAHALLCHGVPRTPSEGQRPHHPAAAPHGLDESVGVRTGGHGWPGGRKGSCTQSHTLTCAHTITHYTHSDTHT